MESLIVGLILASVSGITFLAYKHPDGFEKLFKSIAMFLSYAMMMFLTWNIMSITMSSFTIHGIVSRIPTSPLSTIQNDANVLVISVKRILVSIVVYGTSIGYLVFLKKLPQIIQPKTPSAPSSPPTA